MDTFILWYLIIGLFLGEFYFGYQIGLCGLIAETNTKEARKEIFNALLSGTFMFAFWPILFPIFLGSVLGDILLHWKYYTDNLIKE